MRFVLDGIETLFAPDHYDQERPCQLTLVFAEKQDVQENSFTVRFASGEQHAEVAGLWQYTSPAMYSGHYTLSFSHNLFGPIERSYTLKVSVPLELSGGAGGTRAHLFECLKTTRILDFLVISGQEESDMIELATTYWSEE